MKYLFAVVIISISFLSFAQEVETKKVKKKSTVDWITKKEKYYVLASDTSIKHGEYKRYNCLNDLEESGYYEMGVKDSIWRTYIFGKMVISEGEYIDGAKEGLWNYYTNIPGSKKSRISKQGSFYNDSIVGIWSYYYEGVLEQTYDYSKDSLIYFSTESDYNKYTVVIDSVFVRIKLERPPLLVGGTNVRFENWKKMDSRLLNTLSNGQTDVSYIISFRIRPNGETYGYEMIKGVNTEYDNYIIEFYKKNYKWIPGQFKNGKNVECKIEIEEGYVVRR